jgi:hypothetical protein
MLPVRAAGLKSKLQGVSGFTGAGAFRYIVSAAGSTNYEAELSGVAGVRAELFVHGEYVATLPCKDGKAAAAFDSRLGDPAIRLKADDIIEIRQNGGAVLRGALKPYWL